MRGYLDTLPPSLTAVPNSETLLAPFASLGFLSLLIFSIFSLCFCVLLFSMKFCSCDTQISSFYIVSSPFVPYYSFPFYHYFFCLIFFLPFLFFFLYFIRFRFLFFLSVFCSSFLLFFVFLPSNIYHNRNDLWALGCTLYQMLSGTSPFKDASEWLIFQRIIARELRFPDYFSDEARDLIDRLLVSII